MKLYERVCLVVIDPGFYKIKQLRGNKHLDHALITTLIERWKRKIHTFHLHIGDMTPTLQDVAILTSLLINEPLLTGRGGSINRDVLCDHLLG
jgi:hypothetical protein